MIQYFSNRKRNPKIIENLNQYINKNNDLKIQTMVKTEENNQQVFLFTSTMMILLSQLTSQITIFVENQLLQRIIRKNFQTQIDTIKGQILKIGKLEHNQLLLEDDSFQSLFNFVQQNNITTYTNLLNCEQQQKKILPIQRQFCDNQRITNLSDSPIQKFVKI
ncbi:hypothetical protein pb186bvf_007693 [Paramecium bursaria]